ncbi:MAG: hypothetical protein KGL39_23240 [Patescibacteria group bacterium]|nr:hypothetical protein [Patescibacteria group bacterium]
MTVARFEKDGKVALSDGTRSRVISTEAACRERLIKLLEDAGGDTQNPMVKEFWNQRVKAMTLGDELDQEWAKETFLALDKVWDELVTPPQAEPDIFGGFGI